MAVPDRLKADLHEFVEGLLRHTGAPGFSLALASREQTFTAAWGHSEPRREVPFSDRTVVRTGSMAKLYVAAALMTLVDRGLIELDEPASKYVPFQVENPNDQIQPVLRDLLRHRSGLTANYGYTSNEGPQSLGDHLRAVFQQARGDAYGGSLAPMWSARVNERMQYTNTGAALVGLIIERANADGLSFADLVERAVFAPLGMADTTYEDVPLENKRPDLSDRLAQGYMRLDGYHFPSPRLWIGDFPAGGAVTTPADHAKLLLAYLATADTTIMSPDAISESLHVPDADIGGWGLGLLWQSGNIGTDLEYFGHGGGHMWGFTNSSRCWRNHGIALVTSASHWDLAEGQHRPRYLEAEYCNAFVESWLKTDGQLWETRAAKNEASARSYAIGIVLADRLGPRLGFVPDPAALDDLLANRLTDDPDADIDEDAVRAGFYAIADVARDQLERVPGNVESGAGLDPVQARLAWRSLGGLTGRPLLAF